MLRYSCVSGRVWRRVIRGALIASDCERIKRVLARLAMVPGHIGSVCACGTSYSEYPGAAGKAALNA